MFQFLSGFRKLLVNDVIGYRLFRFIRRVFIRRQIRRFLNRNFSFLGGNFIGFDGFGIILKKKFIEMS